MTTPKWGHILWQMEENNHVAEDTNKDLVCELRPIQAECEESKRIFKDIQRHWKSYGETTDIIDFLTKNAFHETKNKVDAFLFFVNGELNGMAWFVFSSHTYGSVTLHALNHTYLSEFADQLIETKKFDNSMVEFVHLERTSKYRDIFYTKKVLANVRQRMYLYLEKGFYYPQEDTSFTFAQLSSENAEWSGNLSCQCHKISKDYVMYDEMMITQKRIELEKRVWTGHYGEVIRPASVVIFFNNKPVGYCLVVTVKTWGYEKVPWVFDICIDPSFHGQGIGKALSYYFINQLSEMDYPLMGLAVTLCNTAAKKLYERLGFQVADVFYEFSRKF